MDEKTLLQAIGQMMKQGLEPIKEDLQDLKQRMTGMEQRMTKIEITQENVTNKKLDLLFEGQQDTLRKFRQLDELAEKVDDIQTTVEVLKVLTIKK